MAPQYVREMITSMKGEINNNTIIVGDFNTPLTPMDRKDAWNDFDFFEFIKFRFMAQDVIYPGEGSMST